MPGPMRDAALIEATQKIEHYEIAAYGTMSAFAETLGLSDAVKLCEEILLDEKSADRKLSALATETINHEAAELV